MAQENPGIPSNQGTLSERVEGFRREIQSLIVHGVEHPRFEFKRSASIAHENLDDRLDFIKFVQGVANADIAGERCIIVGGDPKEKQFYPVLNTAEFDHATVLPVLAKYLDHVRLNAKRNALAGLSDGPETDGHVTIDVTNASSDATYELQVVENMVDVTGIEPVTPCLQSRCSPS
jgi:hypothetical protein